MFPPDVRKAEFGLWVEVQVVNALDAEQQPRDVLGPLDGRETRVAATASRRVLGLMSDMAFHIKHSVRLRGGLRAVDPVEMKRQLQRTLHQYGADYAEPLDLVEERRGRERQRHVP